MRSCAQPKEETWWLVAGDAASDELLAVKRIALSSTARAKLELPITAASGGALTGVMLHLVSGCYVGLDQQLWLPLKPGM